MIKNIPIEENPREKALTNGFESLSNAELLAIVLRTGNKQESVLSLAIELLNAINGISNLKNVTYNQLTGIKGIKKAKALELLACIELGKRVMHEVPAYFSVEHPSHVYNYLKGELMLANNEHFLVLILNKKHELIKRKTISIGTVDTAIVTPREIYKEALAVNGVAIICVHNHPSGDANPSDADISMTERIKGASKIMNIHYIDHIIIGNHQYYSFEAGKLYIDLDEEEYDML